MSSGCCPAGPAAGCRRSPGRCWSWSSWRRSWRGRRGLRLSVAATAGLLLLGPALRVRLRRRLPDVLADLLAVAVAAQLAVLPVLLALGEGVPLVSVLANAAVAPVVGPATVLGAAAAAVAPVAPWAAQGLAWAAWPPVAVVTRVAAAAEAAPLPVLGLPAAAALAAGVLVILLVRRRRQAGGRGARGGAAPGPCARRSGVGRARPAVRLPARGRVVGGAAALVLLVLAVLLVGLPQVRGAAVDDGWAVVACDVGQGDALVLATGRPGAAVVVDAGPSTPALDRCLDRLGVTAVPLLVVSHAHADHVDGLPALTEGGRRLGQVLVGPAPDPRAANRLARLVPEDVPVVTAAPGRALAVGDLRLHVLAPAAAVPGPETVNDSSLVLAADVDGLRVLLLGDLEVAGQTALLGSGADVRADVVKVAHHGSADQRADLAPRVGAAVGLVSVGADNGYGHPSPLTTAELRDAGTAVARTDVCGDVVVRALDGRPVVDVGCTAPEPVGR